MKPEEIMARYRSFDYAIRYLAPGDKPEAQPETDTVFALEVGPEQLAVDARGRPLLFETEAEAFAWREAGGAASAGPVLAFGPPIEGADDDIEASGVDMAAVSAYAEPYGESGS